ncbi:hypothetical protein N9B73_00580 [Verrucomicrobiales bacterium]|nr:hypothetical protein [Verrucomicrobiales bacterium]|tara:strand:+ start:271 stop:948 length:678 start_codon:yes stop_codon:yes gene_type:complete
MNTRLCQENEDPQIEHLNEAYKAQGDGFFVSLYWLPETRQTVVKHIPDHQNWVGFEMEFWKRINEAEKFALISELSAELDRMDGAELNATWRRIRDWERISSQLSIMAGFLEQDEGFLDMAYTDPAVRPAFKWLTDRRQRDFDTKHSPSSFTSGEMAAFYPHLILHLLDTPERERLMCFSRLFAQIAATKTAKAEQAGAGHPATRSESDSEGDDKPQPESEGRPR